MNQITERIARHLLARIRRLAVLDLYQRASDVGLLAINFPFGERKRGIAWQVSAHAASTLAGDRNRARALVARALKRASVTAHDGFVDSDHGEPIKPVVIGEAGGKPVYQVHTKSGDAGVKPAMRKKDHSTSVYTKIVQPLDSPAMFALLRESLTLPNPSHATVAVLIARAIGESIADLKELREVLMRRNPVILFKIPVSGLERQFGLMLEEALIAPFYASLVDILDGRPLSGHFRETRPEMRKRNVLTGSGRKVVDVTKENLKRSLSTAMHGDPVPLLIVDETAETMRSEFTAAADIVLQCAGIDQALVADLLHVCLGIPASESIAVMDQVAFHPGSLSVDDLALAVRPGRTAKTVVSLLATLAAAAGEDEAEDGGNRSRRGHSSNPLSALRDKPKTTSVDMILPEVEPSTSAATETLTTVNSEAAGEAASSTQHVRTLRVENLSGYGEARPWALDLKDDLALWREGGIGWDEMSSKMLLSGPPGTGKTTFARALCNTLHVPLIVSSVASWLEPGFLGDVLQQMSSVFETARENAPCIVFIDEMDAIGSRDSSEGRGSRYDSYWTTVITRLLELLDGALKTEGVIVVAATNLPDRIDPALLRSGRLEKHIVIPPPDAESLTGILAHHLGSDLAAVLASVPEHGDSHLESSASVAPSSTIAQLKPSKAEAAPKKGQAHV
ncbi:AAA family ATPase [Hoeflea sp. Naph1]|uniref:AAA family ATPase n=1 Tax=Hoeflea sp. Naph1 TaxID=3388653 RepID=UPI00398FC9D7